MMRHFRISGSVLLTLSLALAVGCRPQQPFYFFEDGDLDHYIGVANEIDYPDVEACSLDEVNGAMPPFTLDNIKPEDVWDLSLEEAMRIALCNSKVLRVLSDVQGSNRILESPDFVQTVQAPAITETNPRFGGGVEQALSAFDAQLTSSVFWEKNRERQNTFAGLGTFFPEVSRSDVGSFSAQIQKTAATGGTWSITHSVDYSLEKDVRRIFLSDWSVNVDAEFRQPLLQGNGVQFNRIAGPGALPGNNNGVIIARLRSDQSLADFEAAVRNMVSDVEVAYWELYRAYRNLDAAVAGRDAVLQLWRERKAEEDVGKGGRAEEAQARQQYFIFRAAMEQAQSTLLNRERDLRYMMGLSPSDGRLIRPSDEPTTAKVEFDWYEVHAESLARSVELRKQKWLVKQREMELIAAKNYLLPRLDAVGRYRWLGLGDRLIDSDNSVDNAYGILTSGDFQDWHIGLELSLPIGFRKEMAGVRYAQLNLARERGLLREQELALSNVLGTTLNDLATDYTLAQTRFNRRVAALDELETVKSKFEYGQKDVTFAQVLDAQRRLAEAEVEYYGSLVDYNKTITAIHFRKGSLLEYNGICLAEGPWPGKAYFDAHRRARARDASFYLDYGFTRPKVLSRGPYNQQAGSIAPPPEGAAGPSPEEVPTEVIPSPDPLPMKGTSAPVMTPEPGMSGAVRSDRADAIAGGPASSTSGASRNDGWSGAKTKGPDLGRLDLGPLADKMAGGTSAVQPAGYVEPSGSAAREPSAGQWKRATRADAGYEPLANHPPVEADRAASGWKSVQH